MKNLRCGLVMMALLTGMGAQAQTTDAKSAATTRSSLLLKNARVTTQGGKATASFELSSANAAKVIDASGRDITAKATVATPGAKPRELTLELVKNQAVTVLDSNRAALAPTLAGRKYFPGTIVVAVDDPKKPGQLAVFKGELYIEIQSKPLQWVPAINAYQTGLTVALEASADSQVSNATFQKTTVTLKSTGGASVSRPVVEFTGPGVVADLVLKVSEPDGPVGVTARMGGVMVEDQAEVARRSQQLTLTAAEDRILGYGLEQTQLTVTRLDPAGNPLAAGSAQDVEFSVAGGGKIEPASATIPSGQSRVTVVLTSESTGAGVVTVSAGARTAAATVHFIFPTALILCALVGATFGGVARGFRAGVRQRVRWGRLVMEACVTGVLLTAIVFVGLISDVVPPTLVKSEIGVFVVSGLAGFVGSSVLDKIAGKFFGTEKKP